MGQPSPVALPPGGAVVFHGSNTPGIQQFARSENVTLGQGTYFTSDRVAASEYAERRAKYRGGHACLYRTTLSPETRIADLRSMEPVANLLEDLRASFLVPTMMTSQDFVISANAMNVVDAIVAGATREALRLMGERFAPVLSSELVRRGFHGLLANEGGEARVRAHDSWVIFQPEPLTAMSVPMARLHSREGAISVDG